ncbi:MAG: hypothetical protein WBW41_02715 [Verrucomicrobiia bacterium]
MRKFLGIICGFWLGGLLLAAGADTYQLTDGSSVSGDVVKYDDNGVLIRTPEDAYTNVTWTMFSQGSMQQLAQNPKIRPFVSPFIIPPAEQRPKEQIKIQEVSRLEAPPKSPLFAALFSSSVGLVVMFLIYGANLYAAMEIAVFRSRHIGVVMGVAAVLPILGPIIFLSMPTQGAESTAPLEETEAAPQTMAVPSAAPAPTPAQPPGGIHIASSSWQQTPPPTEKPAPQIFHRGQFMFNHRFFETKFPGFFSLIRREGDKDMVLLVKTPRGQYEVQRITRIAANDIHFEVVHGAARQEVMVPFGEIQEVQLKHKDT